MQELREEFWKAIRKNSFPNTIEDIIDYNIESFGYLIEGSAYVASKYFGEYVLNIMTIKDLFLISLHVLVKKRINKMPGTIHFDLIKKKSKMCYQQIFMEKNPKAFGLLNQVRLELFNHGIEVKLRSRIGSALPFKGVLRSIVGASKWYDLITESWAWANAHETNSTT